MKNIYKEIYGRVQAFMWNPFNRFLILSTYLGSGKTTNTLQALTEEGYTWIYLAPFHHNIYENLEMSTQRKYKYIHLQSRRILCELPEYREIAEKGINIRPICEHCPLKDTTCPYYERKRRLYEEPQNWAGVHHHIIDYLPEFLQMWKERIKMHHFYEVLVIDENPIKVFFKNEIGNPDSLMKLKNIIERINVVHKDVDDVIEFLTFLTFEYYAERDLDYESILGYFRSINFIEFYEVYQETLVEAIKDEELDVSEVPKEYLELFKDMQIRANRETLPYMIMKKKDPFSNKKRYFFTVLKNSPLIDCPLKIIGLDGTANIDIWTSLVGKTPSILERRYKYKNMWILDNQGDARFPYTSWVRYGKMTTTGKRLCKLINDICAAKKNNVLIATTLPLRRYLRKYITAKNVRYCHFYYLRSRNDLYEQADTLVVTCEPNIPPFKLDAFTKLSEWDEDVWRQVFTHEEMVQAVGRNREDLDFTTTGRKREKREIFIFPNTRYPPLKEENQPQIINATGIIEYQDSLKGRKLFPEAKPISEVDLKLYLKTGKYPFEFQKRF